jgi:hypothetical protein
LQHGLLVWRWRRRRPGPAGIENQPAAAARWSQQLSEFILMYDDVRRAEAPEESLYAFLESSYEAGSRLAKWDRTSLEVWRDLNA